MQRREPLLARMAKCKDYEAENERLRKYILMWTRELERGGEEVREMEMEHHGPAGRALKRGTWRDED